MFHHTVHVVYGQASCHALKLNDAAKGSKHACDLAGSLPGGCDIDNLCICLVQVQHTSTLN